MGSSDKKDGDQHSNNLIGAYRGGLGIRHLQVAVMSTATFLAYSLRANLSVAIVAMVDVRNDTATDAAPTFDWDEKVQGYVLSSFFWGYVMTQIPAGVLSSRFGGHRFLCAGILAASTLSLLLPVFAYWGGWIFVCLNRMLQGVSQGFIFPSVFSLLGVWVPPAERSRLSSVTVSAQLLGTVVSTPVSGLLCAKFGWPSVFYVIGGVGAAFGLVMIFLGADSPATHRMISYKEKTYIQSSLGGAKLKQNVPWKRVLTSVPFLSAVCVNTFHGSVFVTFLTKISTYLGTVLKFSISDNGLLTALPYLVSWLLTFVCSWLCDFLIGRGWIQVTTARKCFNSLAHFGGAIFIVLLAHAESRVLAVVYLTCALGLQAGVYVGVQSTFVDLSPNFSGAIFSLANCVCNSIGISGPLIVGFIVSEKGSADQWRIVFYICSSLLVFSNLVFVIWGTAETQFWNWPDRTNSEKEYLKSKRDAELEEKPVHIRRCSLHDAELME